MLHDTCSDFTRCLAIGQACRAEVREHRSGCLQIATTGDAGACAAAPPVQYDVQAIIFGQAHRYRMRDSYVNAVVNAVVERRCISTFARPLQLPRSR